ncbi:MAG: hypothetical protein CMB37_04600 [Euryarchaeota archaeon]|nr:hypothetical protein [Euryarchaeota archaeon]
MRVTSPTDSAVGPISVEDSPSLVRGEIMDEAEQLEPLRIDADMWSHRDLLERIISRWFNVIDEIDDTEIGWQVSLKETEHSSESQLDQLNNHLHKMSWIATLQEGNPYDLVILPEMPRGESLSNTQTAVVWGVFTLFLTLAGASWLQIQNPELQLTSQELLFESMKWFALPTSSVMFLASEITRRISLRFGLDIGHHIPLAVPFIMLPGSPVWPFGVIAYTSQKNALFLTFRNRFALALTSIFSPAFLLVFGFAFLLGGYLLTGNAAPSFDSSPVLFAPSWFTELILDMIPQISESEVQLRSAWLHPLGLAGKSLMIVGWLLLLPLPGFPGDRVLCALIGPVEMEDGANQMWLFIGILTAGIYVVLNGSFLPWLIIVGMGVWGRFKTTTVPIITIANEAIGFEESAKRFFALLFGILLLIGYPGIQPVTELDNWEQGLDTSMWPNEVELSPGSNESISLELRTVGVIDLDIDFEFLFHGSPSSISGVNWPSECIILDEIYTGSCSFYSVGPLGENALNIELTTQHLAEVSTPFSLELFWLEGIDQFSHQINFTFSNTPSPADFYWTWDGDIETPQYCIGINLDSERSGNLSISAENHLFNFDSGERLAIRNGEGVENVCITGDYGSYYKILNEPHVGIVATMDDGSILEWNIPIDIYGLNIIPGGIWPADVDIWSEDQQGNSVSYIIWSPDSQERVICPLSRMSYPVERDENGTWLLNMSVITETTLPSDLENGSIIVPEHGVITLCGAHQNGWSAKLVPSDGILNKPGFNAAWNGTGWTNYGPNPVEVSIETVNFGLDFDWGVDDFTVQPGNSTPSYNSAESEDIIQIVWMDIEQNQWVLHLVSHCINSDGCSSGE